MKIPRTVYICWALLAAAFLTRAGAPPPAPGGGPNPLVWDALEKRTELAAMTNLTYFTFWVTNTSSADAVIISTETECDCTVVEARSKLPWRFAPGEAGELKVRLNTLGKFGLVAKTIAVHTSHGTQTLTIHAKIPTTPAPFNVSVRKQDQLAAQADRQAVFREGCAACHAWPAAGKTGASLFQAACAICHVSDHRAEMVPDLARLTRETGAEYWRTNITSGKAGSLMPAFAKSQGGILDPDQIESLVGHLVTMYPPKNPGATAGDTVATNVSMLPANLPPLPAAPAK